MAGAARGEGLFCNSTLHLSGTCPPTAGATGTNVVLEAE